MRLKPLHTIWFTLLTTLILLVSSVANSAPMMNLKMMTSNTNKVSVETVANTAKPCGSHSMDMNMSMVPTAADTGMECADSSGMVHNCCTTACSFVFVSLPFPIGQPYPKANRATINVETAEPVVHVAQDLYRPPIA